MISIIIPTLNEEKYLPLLLESIKNQSFKDYEIIVADAGSIDNTKKIAKKYGARVVKGGMPGVGRNSGAKIAKGEYIFFLDSDVIVPIDFLSNAYNEMKKRDLGVATCKFLPLSNLLIDRLMHGFANISIKLMQSFNPRAAGFCIFISKDVFKKIKGFDETLYLAEDHDLVQRASKIKKFGVLKSTYMEVSVRRLDKEHRLTLLKKYFLVEANLLMRGKIRKKIVDYEFGNYN